MAGEGELPRRGALAWMVKVLSAGLAAVYAVPALSYLRGRRAGAADAAVDLGALDALPEGKLVRIPVRAGHADAWSEPRGARAAVFVIRNGKEVRALDGTCPHTGCGVDWDEAQGRFRCPCHRSAFAPDGTRLEGPALRGLDPQEVSVDAGRLKLRYRRYRPGRRDRVPV